MHLEYLPDKQLLHIIVPVENQKSENFPLSLIIHNWVMRDLGWRVCQSVYLRPRFVMGVHHLNCNYRQQVA
jgi:hypothetical protein